MSTSLDVRRVLVTGTSSGFGHLAACALARAGHTVFATMRDPDGRNAPARDALRALDVQVVPLDVTSDASVDRGADLVARAGGVDALVHNAGVAAAGITETFSADATRAVFEVNVFGPQRVMRAFMPQLRAAGGGTVVWVTSTDAREVMPFLGVYDAAKAAQEALAEAWRYELHALGMRTVIVQPGTFPSTAILDKLVAADDPARAEAYGDLAAVPAAIVASLRDLVARGEAPDPQRVADLIVAALAPDAPARLTLDPSGFDGAARVNAVCDEVQRDLLTRVGLAHLLPRGR
jgi:NAD(P)-dependent dehydrogenase (short-subunit alcohol dehydrogenase family)